MGFSVTWNFFPFWDTGLCNIIKTGWGGRAHIFPVIDDFSSMAPQPLLVQGLLWTSDQSDVETST